MLARHSLTWVCWHALSMLQLTAAVSAAPLAISIDYVVQPGDNLSSVLYRLGIGRKGPKSWRLYGRTGWLARVKAANPDISSWEHLKPGALLHLQLPQALLGAAPAPAVPQPVCYRSIMASGCRLDFLTESGVFCLCY